MTRHETVFSVTFFRAAPNRSRVNREQTANERQYSEKSEKNEGWTVFMSHSLPEQRIHLSWALHLLLVSVYQRSLAVSVLLFHRLQPCAVNGYCRTTNGLRHSVDQALVPCYPRG